MTSQCWDVTFPLKETESNKLMSEGQRSTTDLMTLWYLTLTKQKPNENEEKPNRLQPIKSSTSNHNNNIINVKQIFFIITRQLIGEGNE